jgi:acetoacetyl-CoA synthetase
MDTQVREGELLWTPDAEFVESTETMRFMRWLSKTRGRTFGDYESLRRWSVEDLEGFWAAVWDYFEIISDAKYQKVLSSREMPGARWFAGSKVNYAEHMLRRESAAPDDVAVVHSSELRPLAKTTWRELGDRVRTMATNLRGLGIGPGDRIVAYMPNIIETLVAMLATTSIGAVWASAAPEFGAKTVIDRFAQIEPKLLFLADGYRFGGKDFDRCPEIASIVEALPTLEHIVVLAYLGCGSPRGLRPAPRHYETLLEGPVPDRDTFAFERVPEDHPLWILFSSGTTGLPKAIVHSHVGIVAELLKGQLSGDGGPDRRVFFYTTTGWMMWNALMSSLLSGASVVLYDGHPAYPGPELLWRLAEESEATGFGASPTYVQIMQKVGLVPKERFDVSRLRSVLLTGSPVTPESAAWFYRNVKSDLWVQSPSGGTELCAALAAGSPILPVYAGEIQTRALGMDVRSWDAAGNDLVNEIGELVVTSPSPSMPLYFWNDPDGRKYHEAYFDVYPGVWRHGDFLKINERGGCYIYGRSDSTLNRFGVRIGTAEVYRILDRLDEVADALIVCLEEPGGAFYMPLFVKLAPGRSLDDGVRATIVRRLRSEGSPRHVPDTIIEVPAIPYTLTGKKMEIPVRRLLAGARAETVASPDAMMDPRALDFYLAFAQARVGADAPFNAT